MTVKDISNNRKIIKVIGEIAETALYLWQRGWAERNAGNISVNITDLISDRDHAIIEKAGTPKIAAASVKGLKDHNFIVWEKHGILSAG